MVIGLLRGRVTEGQIGQKRPIMHPVQYSGQRMGLSQQENENERAPDASFLR